MGILHFLESIRSDFLTDIVSLATLLGEQAVFMIVAVLFLWCFDKKQGFRTFCIYFGGIIFIQAIKLGFRVERPYIKDKTLHPVESAIDGADGYSFPSAHTASAGIVFGSVAAFIKRWWAYLVALALTIVTAFTRLYLGVHTPADVITSIGLSALIIVAFTLFYNWLDKKNINELYIFLVITLISFIAAIGSLFVGNIPDMNEVIEGAWKIFGCSLAITISYILDKKYLHFETKAKWWQQIIKMAGGILIVLALQSGLKFPLTAFFGEAVWCHGIRYFIMMLFAGTVWPMTFKLYNRHK